ncbi:hypothetical protein NC651_012058 [Populus alba x Populus x berolinensis]|nr:hypothetical protein NC651_012058 [Populus alba x Populus x berolinensis]
MKGIWSKKIRNQKRIVLRAGRSIEWMLLQRTS